MFGTQIKIGDVLVRQARYKEAREAYQAAATTVEQAAATRHVVDWQVKLANALAETADLLSRFEDDAATAASASVDKLGSSTFYNDALKVIEAAAIKEPDNQDLQSRKAEIIARIEAQHPTAR